MRAGIDRSKAWKRRPGQIAGRFSLPRRRERPIAAQRSLLSRARERERAAMRTPSERRAEIDIREELDIVRVDPLFLERQRNRYASRGVALVVLLNGAAAIVLLIALAQGIPTRTKPFADAMLVFAIGAALGLASMFLAYVSRTFRLERPALLATWRRPLRWLAIVAAIAGAASFVVGVNMARQSVVPNERTSAPRSTTPAPEPSLPTPPDTQQPGP